MHGLQNWPLVVDGFLTLRSVCVHVCLYTSSSPTDNISKTRQVTLHQQKTWIIPTKSNLSYILLKPEWSVFM